MRLHYHPDFHPGLANLGTPQLHFVRQPPQLNYPPDTVPPPDSGRKVRIKIKQGWYLTVAPYCYGTPTYAEHASP